MRILIDQDGVIAQWGKNWNRHLDTYGEAAAGIPRHEQQISWDLNAGRTVAEKAIIKKIMQTPGFYSELEGVPGARTALKAMVKAGHEVHIVTSPYLSNPTCASDKLNWVIRHYGSHWGSRVILTNDKSLVRGDILIDDRPDVTNADKAEWEHVVFDAPYNREVQGKIRMVNWHDWEEILHWHERGKVAAK